MPIDFHAEHNRYTYASREADPSWVRAMAAIVNPQGKRVVDIGCGGGTYTRAWAHLGAAEVVGIDFSAQMVRAATERSQDISGISFHLGDAVATGLSNGYADVVFARALVHHLADLPACLHEAHRILDATGIYIIQDRTPDDVQLAGSHEHIRGYVFERFPRLLEVEAARRPRREHLLQLLHQAGFTQTQTLTLWEVRQRYPEFAALAEDLRQRAGRSILHELTTEELSDFIDFIAASMPQDEPITKKIAGRSGGRPDSDECQMLD
jgi:ubiquinone/menaquinone biosynthesis C-methylase UbiE